MARSATKRALRALNDGASSVAGGVKSGTKFVVATLPGSKPTKLARLRGAVINRKVLIPTAIAAGVGVLGYSTYRLITSDERLFGLGHYPGFDDNKSERHEAYTARSSRPAADPAQPNRSADNTDTEQTDHKPANDGYSPNHE